MKCARPLFVLLLIAAFATVVLAADDRPSSEKSTVPAQAQGAFTRGPSAQKFLEWAGLLLPNEETRVDLGRPLAPRSTVLNGGICYTLRMYRVKHVEHLADGDTGRSGYTTCELGSNYQYRSAVAHARDTSAAEKQK